MWLPSSVATFSRVCKPESKIHYQQQWNLLTCYFYQLWTLWTLFVFCTRCCFIFLNEIYGKATWFLKANLLTKLYLLKYESCAFLALNYRSCLSKLIWLFIEENIQIVGTQWANGFHQFHKSVCIWKIYKYYYILIAFNIQKPNNTLLGFWFYFSCMAFQA